MLHIVFTSCPCAPMARRESSARWGPRHQLKAKKARASNAEKTGAGERRVWGPHVERTPRSARASTDRTTEKAIEIRSDGWNFSVDVGRLALPQTHL